MPGNQLGLHVPPHTHVLKNLDSTFGFTDLQHMQITCQIHLLISKVLQNPSIRLEMRPKEWRYQIKTIQLPIL